MRTQIALAAIVAFAAAQDDSAEALEEQIAAATEEANAAVDEALADLEDALGDIAVTGGDWEGEWDDKDMMDGGWMSPELEDA